MLSFFGFPLMARQQRSGSRCLQLGVFLAAAAAVVATQAAAESADTDPQQVEQQVEQWMWSDPAAPAGASLEWRREFTLERLPPQATVAAHADFCELDLWINDTRAQRSDAYEPPSATQVADLLRVGVNTLRIRARTLPGPSAVAFRMELHSPDQTRVLVSDETWQLVDHGSQFRQTLLGPVAEAVRVSHQPDVAITEVDDYTQWKRALGTTQVTAPSTFVLRPGYEIELLRSAKADEGSWIALAFDNAGRLIIGREDHGLLRLHFAAKDAGIERVETINSDLKEPRGILAVGSMLLVNANESRGMFRLTDTTGDDQFDAVERVREFPGSAGHGRNNLTLGPDGNIYSIHGDAVEIPRGVTDRTSPFRAHRQGRDSREGSLVRCDVSGANWEVVAAGLRNPFGIAFNSDGEAFTYDADAEHDMGAPWYRPTRVVHLVSGADYGWRGVTGSWPPYFPDHPDNALPNLDVGKGSPTSVAFGTGSQFEPDLQEALFILDWAYGRILAVRMRPRGCSYVCRLSEFVKGRPFNATGLTFGPDGAMYVVTGGRKTQSALYRIRYTGPPAEAEPLGRHEQDCAQHAATQRQLRRQIEEAHVSPARVRGKRIIGWLGHPDPRIRHAARIALEHLPSEEWPEAGNIAATQGADPGAAASWLTDARTHRAQLQLLMATARDPQKSDPASLWRQALKLEFQSLRPRQQRELVHVTRQALVESRGELDSALRRRATDFWHDAWDQADSDLQLQILELLVRLGSPHAVNLGLQQLADETEPSRRLHVLFALRSSTGPWTASERRQFVQALNAAHGAQGGAGLPMFLQRIREEFLATLSPSEVETLESHFGEELTAPSLTLGRLKPVTRPRVRHWTLEDMDVLVRAADHSNPDNGRRLFEELQCSRCHRVNQLGAAVGPDLTSVARRFDRRGILEAILEPSRVVDEAYRSDQLVLQDGRVLVGRIVPELDYRSPELRLIPFPYDGSPEISVAKAAIEQHSKSSQSVMPDGLLDTATRSEIGDLLAFLDRRPEGSAFEVTKPPARLKLPEFYQKYISANGYPIVSSAKVSDYALKEAAYLVNMMLAQRPDVRDAMIQSGSRLIVMSHDEFTTDVPEHSELEPKDYWDARARGLGGSRTDPVCSCGEENLLGYPGDPYAAECILIHEFAHNIHLRGLVNLDPTFDERLKRAYDAAMSAGLWKGKYASVNHHEYFAEGVQSWFNNNRPPDHDHNHVDTRKELREYDPGLAELCAEVFGTTELVYTKPQTRLSGHLTGYDPETAPHFVWPERLEAERRSIREKARARGQAE